MAKQGKPWYFLEELYPAFGNLVPRDIGAREILRICEMGLGVDGKNQVYLDVTDLPQNKNINLKPFWISIRSLRERILEKCR